MNFKAFKFNRAARLLLVTIFLYGIAYNAWGLFLNLFVLASDFDKQFLGLANMVPAGAALIFGVPLGMLLNKLGQKKAMLIGLAAASTACGIMAAAGSAAVILTASFIWGIGTTLFTISQAPLVMEITEEDTRLTLFSLNSGLQFLSGVAGNYLAGLIPGLASNLFNISEISPAAYQTVFFCCALVGFTAIVPVYLIHEEKRAYHPVQAARVVSVVDSPADFGIKWLLRKDVMRLLMPNLITGAGAGILIPYLNVFYMEKFGLGNEELGFLFSLSSLITGAAMLGSPRLASVFGGKVKMVVITQSLSLFFLMLLGLSPVFQLSSLGFLMRAMLMNLAPPVWTAFVMEQTAPARQGTMSSYLNLLWTAGWLVGPYISGLVQENFGFTPLFIATCFLYGLAILFTWVFFHDREPRAQMIDEAVTPGFMQEAAEEGK